MSTLLANAFLYLAVFVLLIEAAWDHFRSVEIPIPLLLAPFVIAIASLVVGGQLIVLIASLFLFIGSQIRNAFFRRALCALCLIAFIVIRWDVGFFLVFFWLLYEFHIFAGADALACISLMLIRPDWILGFWLLIGLGAGSWLIGLRRNGLGYFRKIAQAMAGLRSAPVTEEQLLEEGRPALWMVFAGSFLYVLIDAFILSPGGGMVL